jgi:tRNA/tmRNA/rRNA uracil-C5-methylase (TrmA/RlmC/RlmD family)
MKNEPPRNFNPEPFAYHTEIELRIDDLTNLGAGVGRHDGWVVMVPFALPGERVRVRVYRNYSNYSEADLLEVLEPSVQRMEPQCRLFQQCGGCQYQHVNYTAQLEWKRRQVTELMERIGGIHVVVAPPIASIRTYGYRSKITPHYQKPDKHGKQPIGFLRQGARMAIIDVESCPIATDAINEALPDARDAARRAGGAQRRRRGGTLLMREALEGVVTDPKRIVSEKVGDYIFQFKAGEFFQNNPFILPDLVAHVVASAQGPGVMNLIDAYCGVGLFAIHAAAHFEKVTGVEISEASVNYARVNAELNGIKNVRVELNDAAAIFSRVPLHGEQTAVIIDPPRKGCDESFRRQLMGFAPRRIVYVSCDPATQARDLVDFIAGGYGVESIQPFDLFPQTRHIENVVTLNRRNYSGVRMKTPSKPSCASW